MAELLDLEGAVRTVLRLEPAAEQEWTRLGVFNRYMRGDHVKPFTPRSATDEYKALQDRAITNLIPLVVRGVTQRLYVDGHKANPSDDEQSSAWVHWQGNQMDMRQKALYEAGGIFGYAWCSVMPIAGTPLGQTSDPIIRPRSPLSWYGEFDDETEDVWPRFVLRSRGPRRTLVDAFATYNLRVRETKGGGTRLDADLSDPVDPESWYVEHEVLVDGERVCPFRYVPVDVTLTGRPQGDVEQAKAVQDRLNQTVFDLLLAQTYSSTKVRYMTGMVPPGTDRGGADEYEPDEPQTPQQIADEVARRAMATGRAPIELYHDKMLLLESTDAKVGTLDESNLEQLVLAVANCLRIFGLASQTPPHDLLGEMVNVSAEGLIAAESSRGFKVGDRKTIIGEALEDVLRAAAGIAGDAAGATAQAAQLIWRDTDPQSFAATVDGLGKLALMLDVPVRWLWSKIPGVTQTDIRALEAAAEAEGPVEAARRRLERQAVGTDGEIDGTAAA